MGRPPRVGEAKALHTVEDEAGSKESGVPHMVSDEAWSEVVVVS